MLTNFVFQRGNSITLSFHKKYVGKEGFSYVFSFSYYLPLCLKDYNVPAREVRCWGIAISLWAFSVSGYVIYDTFWHLSSLNCFAWARKAAPKSSYVNNNTFFWYGINVVIASTMCLKIHLYTKSFLCAFQI